MAKKKKNYDGWAVKNVKTGQWFKMGGTKLYVKVFMKAGPAMDNCLLQDEEAVKVRIVPVESEVEK